MKENGNAMEPITISVEKAAEALGVSKPTVYRMMEGEGLPFIKLNRRTVIPVDRLKAWVSERTGD